MSICGLPWLAIASFVRVHVLRWRDSGLVVPRRVWRGIAERRMAEVRIEIPRHHEDFEVHIHHAFILPEKTDNVLAPHLVATASHRRLHRTLGDLAGRFAKELWQSFCVVPERLVLGERQQVHVERS